MTVYIRLAMRVEGEMWNAYIAEKDTMQGAILIGSIAMFAVRNDPERKQAFMDMMRGILEGALRAMGADVAGHELRAAPQHERAGRA